MLENIIHSFENFWNSMLMKMPEITVSIVVIIVFVLIGKLFHGAFRRRIQKKWKDSIVSSFMGELLKWVFYIIGFIIALFNLGLGGVAGSLVAGAGVTAIIIGFAFKDIAENFLAGILLAINSPFKIGDIIEVAGIKGPVRGLDLRSTQIKMVDGRDIYIPNSAVVKNVFTNYTQDGFLRLEFLIGVDTPTDVDALRKLALRYFDKQKDILQEPAPNLTMEEFGESSITVKITFWINIFNNKKEDQALLGEPVKSRVMREIKDLFLEQGINMPAQILEHKMYAANDPLIIKQ